jgi:nucleoside-diphosphate-sugar epimerase
MNEENQATTVLVTGASGYIAMHCVLQLLQQGYRVRGTLRSPAREKKLREAFAEHIDADDRLEFVTADLMSDDGWADAVDGCRFVHHVASPHPTIEPKDEDELIVPAREGTLRVLQAAANAGVQRVVLTSSVAAIIFGHDRQGRIFTEADWSNIDADIGAYGKSKTLAERAAWDYIENLPAGKTLELAVINPSFVFGPLLDENSSPSVEVVRRLLRREVPGCPRLGFPIVDVRDVATAHLLAMTAPQAAGKRFICNNEFFWLREIALVLENEFAGRGYRIPTRPLPDFAMRLMGLFDGGIRRLVPSLGQRTELSSELLQNTLDWQPRPVREAIVDTAESLIEYNL